jgi:hypothetical protein
MKGRQPNSQLARDPKNQCTSLLPESAKSKEEEQYKQQYTISITPKLLTAQADTHKKG